MYRKYNYFIIKLIVISSIFVGVFNLWNNFINANEVSTKTISENKEIYNQNNNSQIGKTWVALSTNLWLKYTKRNNANANLYSDILSINNLISNKNLLSDDLLNNHMIMTNEYLNVLKTDIKKLLDTTVIDRSELLNALIEEYEYRYENAVLQISLLTEQRNIYINDMNIANSNIESIKNKMENDFNNDDAISSKENIVSYLEEKNNYYFARVYITYIDQFLVEYQVMNNYNKKIIDTLINNKDAIIKNSYIVLPDTWLEVLKELELIYDEETYKEKTR